MIELSIYRVFVSGPSDVGSDMETIKEVLSEINFIFEALGIRFDIFDWGKVTPGLSREPQARINDQAGDPDIIIATLGSTLGSPTEHFSSGTVEEIEKAIIRSGTSIFADDSVMVFFKTVQLDSTSGNLDDVLKVQNFKKDLRERKILYKQYENDQSLRESILRTAGIWARRHLEKRESSNTSLVTIVKRAEISEASIDHTGEVGLLDYIMMGSKKLTQSTSLAEGLSTAIQLLGEQLSVWNATVSEGRANLSAANARHLLDQVSADIETCASSIDSSTSEMALTFVEAFDAFDAAIDLQISDIGGDDTDQHINDLKSAIYIMLEQLDGALVSLKFMRETTQSLPRITTNMTAAKKHLLKSLEIAINSLDSIAFRATETLGKI